MGQQTKIFRARTDGVIKKKKGGAKRRGEGRFFTFSGGAVRPRRGVGERDEERPDVEEILP